MAKMKIKLPISKGELFWSIVASLIGVSGLVLSIIGIVGANLPVKLSDNGILQADMVFQGAMGGLTFTWFGVILVLLGSLVAVIFLNFYAKKADLDEERAIRKAQRMKILSSPVTEEKPVTEVESTPVEKTE